MADHLWLRRQGLQGEDVNLTLYGWFLRSVKRRRIGRGWRSIWSIPVKCGCAWWVAEAGMWNGNDCEGRRRCIPAMVGCKNLHQSWRWQRGYLLIQLEGVPGDLYNCSFPSTACNIYMRHDTRSFQSASATYHNTIYKVQCNWYYEKLLAALPLVERFKIHQAAPAHVAHILENLAVRMLITATSTVISCSIVHAYSNNTCPQ